MLYFYKRHMWRRAGLLCAVFIVAWAGPPRAAALECPETGTGAVPALVSQSQARLLIAGGSVDIANEIDALIVKLKVEHPGISYGDLTNALIAAYCPLVSGIPSLSSQEKSNRLQKFEALLRQRLSSEIMLPGSLILAHVLLTPDVYRALRDMADHAGQTPSDLMAALLTKAAGEERN